MTLNIRKATKADLPEILSLYSTVLDNGKILSPEKAGALFNKMMSYPNYSIYLAENEHEAVGTFALLIMDNLAHYGTPSGVVEDVAVKNEYQGKGIGKAMMKFAIKCCEEAGCYKLSLSSNLKRHEAHAFYESLDFARHGYSFLIDLR